MSRKEARDITFKIVYQNEFKTDEVNNILENMLKEKNVEDVEELKYIKSVVKGINKNNGLLEEKIKENLKDNWNLNRISKLNKAILKVAIYELLFMNDEIPTKVSISEALEFIDLYGDKKDKSFINGILANIVQNMEGK